LECHEVYRWLQAYFDDEITAGEERQLEKHIRVCPKCRKKLFGLQRTISAIEKSFIADKPDDEPSDAFTTGVLSRVKGLADDDGEGK